VTARPRIVRIDLKGKIGPDEISGQERNHYREVNILRRSW
jgi:hypothetical protein